jgi:hypothetical protein
MPRARKGRGKRHIGTSAPSARISAARGPNAPSASSARPIPRSASIARSAAAASADPPPMPEAAGSAFVSSIAAPCPSARIAAARSARFVESDGTPAASGPRTFSVSPPRPGETTSSSPTSAKVTSESSRW